LNVVSNTGVRAGAYDMAITRFSFIVLKRSVIRYDRNVRGEVRENE